MRRVRLLSALALAAVAALAPAIAAADDGPTVEPGDNDTIDVGHGGARPGGGGGGDGGDGGHGGGSGGGGHGGGGGEPGEPPPPTILDPQILFRDGEPCVVAGRQPGDPNSGLALDLEVRYLHLRSRYGACAEDTGPGGGAGAVPSAASAVAAWADQVQLPVPELELQPGLAISGKAAYLEIGGAREGVWQFQALGWTIDVTATSTYTVDWGDGTVDTGITTQGGPWPDGDLTHTYLASGAFTIEVTQHWTADWTATGHGTARSGRIEGLLWTAGQLPDFPVEEVQGVRTR